MFERFFRTEDEAVSAETLSLILARQRAEVEERERQLAEAAKGGPHPWACSEGEMAAAIQRCRDGALLEQIEARPRKLRRIG